MRVELGHVGMLPVWGENNRNEMAAGREKTPDIRPILIDREIPVLEARLDELNKATSWHASLGAERGCRGAERSLMPTRRRNSSK